MKNKIKSKVWIGVFLVFLLVPVSVIAVSALQKLNPSGRERVALTADGGGTATWNPEGPAVFDGSFSARLDTADVADGEGNAGGAGIMIGPTRIHLSALDVDDVRFWMYAYSCADRTPYVDFVLDNGRTMEGISSVPVNVGETVESEVDQGYPSANLWIQMMPSDAWYSSFAVPDPLIPDTFAPETPKTLADWQALFPDARVIQVKIQYGYGNQGADADCTVFVDKVHVRSRLIKIEPETFAGTAVPSTGKPFA